MKLQTEIQRGAITVPSIAVQRRADGLFVYVIKDDNSATIRPIVVQKQDETQTVVKSGVAAQERVVTTGFARLTDGSKVTIGSNDGTPATPAGQRQRGQRPAGSTGERAPRADGSTRPATTPATPQ